ncbi:V-type ATPase [Hyaloraphidium curvatum]|nr:V-type ATPase [Hyaloraphidium curvatum]
MSTPAEDARNWNHTNSFVQTQGYNYYIAISDPPCPFWPPFFGMMGVSMSMIFSSVGAGYGTALAGMGIAGMGQYKPDLIMKSLIPVVMAGIICVYGLVVSVLISGNVAPDLGYSAFDSFVHLAAGISTGFAGVAAGYAIGHAGDAGVRDYSYQSRVFVGMVLILIFAEVLGLYGLIVSLILNTKANQKKCYDR